MNFDVEKRTILKVKHGSHAYGLNTPESDIDYRGVCIEPFDHTVSVENNFEQLEEHVSKGFPVDSTIFGLFKFIRLAIPSNPNVGTYTRPLENISISLVDMKVVWNTQCVATAFVDFTKERIMDENNDSKSNNNV